MPSISLSLFPPFHLPSKFRPRALLPLQTTSRYAHFSEEHTPFLNPFAYNNSCNNSMGDVKRWIVTYTRHMKQKRKVYQDGSLELNVSCNKVFLYNDCGELLESRFLKKDEVIDTGGTLAFDSHLIDIGELERKCKPPADLNVQGRSRKSVENTGVLGQKGRQNSAVYSKKVEPIKIRASQNQTKLACNSTRGYRKGELHRFGEIHTTQNVARTTLGGIKQPVLQSSGSVQNNPNATQAAAREWHVLYTTQMTQKAKKYHDGILQLSLCGSYAKQIMLYDDCGKLLDNRFLKNDETVESGGGLTFNAHLVEIGELKGHRKAPEELTQQGRDAPSLEIGIQKREYGHKFSAKSKMAEWQGNGFQKNHSNATQNIERENRTKSPNSGACRNHPYAAQNADHEVPPSHSTMPDTMVTGNLQTDTSGPVVGLNSGSSNGNTVTCSSKSSGDKLLRDACQILSVLKKPITLEGFGLTGLQKEQTCPSQSLELLQSGLQDKLPGQSAAGIEILKENVEERGGNDFQNSETENTNKTSFLGSCRLTQFRATQEILSSDFTDMDPGKRDRLPLDCLSASSNSFPGTKALGFLKTKLDGEHIIKPTVHLSASIEASLVPVVTNDLPEDSQIHSIQLSTTPTDIQHGDCSNENLRVERTSKFTSLDGEQSLNYVCCDLQKESFCADECKSSCGAMQILKDIKYEGPIQDGVGNLETDGQTLDEAFFSGSSLTDPPACAAATIKNERFESLPKKSMDMDDFPSFDLGI